ncbi:MAG TPA: hypothetical protein IAD31_08960 [Candidatus Enterenecus faecium]|uniref:Uncharacterized protein n=1 Tax=Candidatus Enterenecus faecium TaxID=2840780 RepID=A0A9D0YU09_9FIRM|nr:hypothetical protein [Candidatus Enterenecus faecium]HIT25468.1 hypothetical protein [Candidatus Enterenecus avicola]
MNGEEFLAAVLVGLAGGSGVTGLAMGYLRRYIDRRLEQGEAEAQLRQEHRQRRQEVEDQLHHAYGRCIFWLNHAVTKPPANGELAQAMDKLTQAEEAKKKLDREILAAYEKE